MPIAPQAPTTDLLALDPLRDRLARLLPHWRVAGDALQRVVRTSGWKGTLMAVNTIGHLAEAAWHHPELQVGYDRVTIRLSTHDAGGITEKDMALAERIESVLMWQPGREPGAVLSGTPDDAAYILYD